MARLGDRSLPTSKPTSHHAAFCQASIGGSTFDYKGVKRGSIRTGWCMGLVRRRLGGGERRTFRWIGWLRQRRIQDRGIPAPDGFDVRTDFPENPWEAGEANIEATVRFDPGVAVGASPDGGWITVTEAPDGSLTAVLR
jgi:hypothetical protein